MIFLQIASTDVERSRDKASSFSPFLGGGGGGGGGGGVAECNGGAMNRKGREDNEPLLDSCNTYEIRNSALQIGEPPKRKVF